MTPQPDPPRLELDGGNVVLYVGGPSPYFWIGTDEGTYYDSISAGALEAFITSTHEGRV